MFLLINLGVVLPILFLLALASSLYYCYNKFYAIPKILASENESIEFEETIINELNKIHLENRMQKMEQTNEYSNKFVIPNENIFDYSNRLMMYN